MRTTWIATFTLAVIGGFFLVLKLLWLFHVEPEWLPYLVHVIAAALAGAVMANASPPRSLREPIAGGVLAVAVLAAVSLALPRAFTLTAARSDHRWLIVPLIAVVSGVACAGGAWLVGRTERAPRSAWIAAIAAMTSACTILLGVRVAQALGLPTELGIVMVATCVAAFLAGAATQAVVAVASAAPCAAGVTAFVAFGILEQMTRAHATLEPTIVLMLAPILAAAIGANMVWRYRTPSAPPGNN